MGIVTDMTNKSQTCIDACNKCAQSCYECFTLCLKEPDMHTRINCISMLVECGMMCSMSAADMAMMGTFHKEHCG